MQEDNNHSNSSFLHVEASLRGLSFARQPDPEVNILFEVGDLSSPQQKFLLEFVEDGIRVYQEDDSIVSEWIYMEKESRRWEEMVIDGLFSYGIVL